MPTADALTGLGMPAQLASLIGGNPTVLVTKGTGQTTAAVMLTRNVELSTASSQTGAIPPATAGVAEPYFITNQSASVSGVVYPPVGHNLNGATGSTLTVPVNRSAILWQYKPKNWCYIVTAT